jgi:hypothetical protein
MLLVKKVERSLSQKAVLQKARRLLRLFGQAFRRDLLLILLKQGFGCV